MPTIAQRIRQVRLNRGWSLSDVERQTGLASAVVSRIETGRTPNPAPKTITKLATALGCSADYLLGLSDDPGPTRLYAVRESVEKAYTQLEDVMSRLQASGAEVFKPDPVPTQVPLLGTVHAGEWREAIERADSHLLLVSEVAQLVDFALRVSGDSMFPLAREGDYVFATIKRTPVNGDVVVAAKADEDGNATGDIILRIFREYGDGTRTLEAVNPSYPPIHQFHPIAVVVATMRPHVAAVQEAMVVRQGEKR